MKTINHFFRASASILAMTGLVLLIASGCTKTTNDPTPPGGGDPPANEVYIQGSAFNPVTLTVPAGTTVTWTNKDGLTHNVTSNTGVFISGSMANNAVFSYTFNTPGTYPYHCTIHTNMTATVVVN